MLHIVPNNLCEYHRQLKLRRPCTKKSPNLQIWRHISIYSFFPVKSISVALCFLVMLLLKWLFSIFYHFPCPRKTGFTVIKSFTACFLSFPLRTYYEQCRLKKCKLPLNLFPNYSTQSL